MQEFSSMRKLTIQQKRQHEIFTWMGYLLPVSSHIMTDEACEVAADIAVKSWQKKVESKKLL